MFYKSILPILFFFYCVFVQAQKREYLLIDIQTQQKKTVKDSINAVKFLDSLAQNNYFFTQLVEVKKKENRTEIYFDKGKNYNKVNVSLSDELSSELQSEKHFFTPNFDSLKQVINKKYIDKGFAFSRVKSKYKGIKNEIPQVEIYIIKDQQRKINGFVLKGYEKVPQRFIKNLEKEFRGKTYDDKNLVAINKELQNHQFVTLERPPQTLFTKDSTQIFLFIQKKKVNTFDGILGFGNNESEKFTFNGTLNVNFRNMFNGFESIGLYWQRNPDKGQTFNLQTDVPYLFKSNIGTNINLNIYRQDSTFANVKFLPSVYYHLSNRQKVGLRGTFETSSVLNSLYTQGQDYNKSGIGAWYNYTESSDIELFMHKMQLCFEADILTTNYTENSVKANQMRYFFYGERNFHIKENHYLNLRGETGLMSSKNDFTNNELMRFGGWNSLRGFNENSLIADFYYYGNAEYRYLIENQAFFDVFMQYAELNNKLLNAKPRLYSFGIGFNFMLPIGLMSFQIANGSEFGNPIKFNDTKIHWGILTRF